MYSTVDRLPLLLMCFMMLLASSLRAAETTEEQAYPINQDFPFGFWVIDKGFAEGWSDTLGEPYERHTEKIFRDLQRNHVNALMLTHRPVTQWHLDTAVKYGMRMTTMPQFLYAHIDHTAPANPEPLEVVMERWRAHVQEIMTMKNRHGFLGYHIFDEPYQQFSGPIKQVADMVTALDPGYPALYTHQSMPLDEKGHPEEWSLLKSLSVILSDCYSVCNAYGRDPWYYGDVQLPEQRRPNPDAHQWTILQGFGYGQLPTIPELRIMVFNNVAHGAKGIFFFVAGQSYISSNPKAPWFVASGNPWFTQEPYLDEISRIGAHLTSAGPLLLPLKVNDSYPIKIRTSMFTARVRSVAREVFIKPTDPMLRKPAIHAGAFTGEDYDVVVIHNNDPWRQQQGSVDIKGRKRAFDLLTLEPVGQPTADGVKWTVDFAPGDGRLYLLTDSTGAQKQFDHARDVVLGQRYKQRSITLTRRLDLARSAGADIASAADALQQAEQANAAQDYQNSLAALDETAVRLDTAIAAHQDYSAMLKTMDDTRRTFVEINDWFMARPEYQDSNFPEQSTIQDWVERLVQLTGRFGQLENAMDDGKINPRAAGDLQDEVERLKARLMEYHPRERSELSIAVLHVGPATKGVSELARYLEMLYTRVDVLPIEEADLAAYQLAWVHIDGESPVSNAIYCEPFKLPAKLLSEAAINNVQAFVKEGNGLVCTGLAASLGKELGIEPSLPNENYWGPVYTPGGKEVEWERWNVCGKVLGLKPIATAHPLFNGFNADGFGVEAYDDAELITKAVWNRAAGQWPTKGTVLAGYYSDGADIPNQFAVAVEYAIGKGKVLLLGDMFDPASGAVQGIGGYTSRWNSPYHKLMVNIVTTYSSAAGK